MNMNEITGKPYQVVYRIADQDTTSGTPQERYDDITAKLKNMQAASKDHEFKDTGHVATSTWLVRSHHERAADLVRQLKGRLTPNIDILRVTEIVANNSADI